MMDDLLSKSLAQIGVSDEEFVGVLQRGANKVR